MDKAKRLLAVAACSLTVGALAAGSAFAGEYTGNGKPTAGPAHAKSECVFSGQEDLQFFYDDEDTMPKPEPTKGDPSHAQSWGQIPKADRDFLTSIGSNPGIACNGHLNPWTGEE